MAETSLGAAELRFAELIWANAPVSSGALVGLANEALGWKKSTTYTVLRRLCEKGLFENDGGTVRALLSREDYLARESRSFVDRSFGGSLPAVLAAVTRGKTLTREQQDTLQALIDEARRALGANFSRTFWRARL